MLSVPPTLPIVAGAGEEGSAGTRTALPQQQGHGLGVQGRAYMTLDTLHDGILLLRNGGSHGPERICKISQVSGSFPEPPKAHQKPPHPRGSLVPGGGGKQGRSLGTCWLPPHAPITQGLSRVGPGARGCSPNPS